MKIRTISVAIAFAMTALVACNNSKEEGEITLKTELDSVTYCIGTSIGTNIKQDLKSSGLDSLDLFILSNAFKLAYKGDSLQIDPVKAQQILQSYFQKAQAKKAEAEKKKFEKNIKAGEDFLKANASKPGVISLPSGLQYKILTEGKGEKPKASDQVKAHYKGSLIDGKVFESSYDKGEPITIPVMGVIPGWSEALQLMTVGSKWELYIPENLAYGSNPRPGGPIEPYATLVFEIELLSIEKAK